MNSRLLEYLVAVAQHKNFNAAANACHISQPALSIQLKKLEEQLGVQLFERNNKQVMVTPIGEELVARSTHILEQISDLKEVAKLSSNLFEGELKLGAFPTLAPYYFPQILPKINDAMPKLKLYLVEEKTATLIKMMEEGDLDCAFLALPFDAQNLTYEPIFKDEFYLATNDENSLSDLPFIEHDALSGLDLLLLEDGHCMRQNALDVCALDGAKEMSGFRATSLETLRQMVKMGTGITLIPNIAKQDHDGLTYLPFNDNPPSREIALVWRKTSAKYEIFEKLISLLKG